jgi:hypothetical protein
MEGMLIFRELGQWFHDVGEIESSGATQVPKEEVNVETIWALKDRIKGLAYSAGQHQ